MLKKIRILESNNSLLDHRALERYDSQQCLEDLLQYVKDFVEFDEDNEINTIEKVLFWVSNQWIHSGMNSPGNASSLEILRRADNGESFRCVEYGKVTRDILRSLGFISRQIALRTPDSAYGGTGRGHVATEVWSNDLEKWIFIDPQFSVMIEDQGELLSYIEVYQLIKKGCLSILNIKYDHHLLNQYKRSHEEYVENYLSFIKNYTGFINEKFIKDDVESSITLLLDDEMDVLSFQGMPVGPYLSTKKVEDFYIKLNQTSVSFVFAETIDMQKIITENNIKDDLSYISNMEKFAAIPHYTIRCKHNTPFFDHFEYQINNGAWSSVKEDTFKIKQDIGITELQVRTVNKSGKKGLITKMLIEYK